MKSPSAFALFTVLLMPAVATAQHMNMSGSLAEKANMQAMEKMYRVMPKKGTGDADKDFVMMMIPHHQGAIDMVKVEIQYGKDPALKKMAEKIIKDQERETAEVHAEQKRLDKK